MTEYKENHDYETDKMCEEDCGNIATEDSGLCEECDLATYDCKECKDTGEILVFYDDETGRCLEYEEPCSNPIHEDINKGITR